MNLFSNSDSLTALCRQHQIKRLAVFGSVAKGVAHADSDVDLLVEFRPGVVHSRFKLFHIKDELSHLLGNRKIDLLTMSALNQKRFSRFPNRLRDDILASAITEYQEESAH